MSLAFNLTLTCFSLVDFAVLLAPWYLQGSGAVVVGVAPWSVLRSSMHPGDVIVNLGESSMSLQRSYVSDIDILRLSDVLYYAYACSGTLTACHLDMFRHLQMARAT